MRRQRQGLVCIMQAAESLVCAWDRAIAMQEQIPLSTLVERGSFIRNHASESNRELRVRRVTVSVGRSLPSVE